MLELLRRGLRVAHLTAVCAVLGAWPAQAQPAGEASDPAGVAVQNEAQNEAQNAARPTVGLVLSGGGARGGAHIGALKALEELRVPIDYIGATSIGAVVGGFYAAGMTVPEMEELIASFEWETAFLNATPRPLRSFRRKRDDDLFLVDTKPGLNDGEFELPAGLVQGQVIDTIISRETLRASRVESFDELVVPFRAVATDLVTGEAVVLASGSLPRVLRASMSIPAALTPIEIDGRLLVDGGVSMNLPVEVVQGLGADVLVAVDITSPLLARETLRSVVDVTTQLTNLLGRGEVEEQRELLDENDVLITPTFVEDLGSTSFERMSESIQAGYDAVMRNRPALERYALDAAGYADHLAARNDPRMQGLPSIEFIEIDNDSPIAESVIRTRLGDIELGEPLDVEQVERAMNKVYGLEFFQNVRYSLIERDGRTGLHVELDERSWGPNYLQLGMQYSSAGEEDALFGLAASYLRTARNELGGEWRATFVIGDEPALLADLYQPFGDRGLYFYAPALSFESNLYNVFVDDERVNEAKVRQATAEFAVGRELPSWAEYRFGVRMARGDTKLRVGDPQLLPEEDFRRGEVFGGFSVDTIDSVSFPRAGTLATMEWRVSRDDSLGADANFKQIAASVVHANTWGRHTVITTGRYDATVSGKAPVHRMFRMGGLFDLSGLNRNEISGQYAMRVGTSYFRRIGDLTLFPAFAGVSLELGNAWTSRGDISLDNSLFGASFWAGVSTPVGPVYVGYGLAEDDNEAFYVSLGRVF
jgi:NTE family protein